MNHYASATEKILTKTRTIITCSKKQMILFFLAYGLLPAALAAAPLWTMLPAPGSNPTQSLTANSTATVQYIVQNQSAKAKQLAIIAPPGITQTSPCFLAPKGQNGSSCILNLSISGAALPEGGVHGGPSLCVTDTQGKPNPNQCYQPAAANSLNISTVTPTNPIAQLSVTPTVLMFTINTTASLTILNNSSSTVAAEQINADIPQGSAISVQNNGCPNSLAVGASCVITLTSTAAEGPTPVTISGNNTTTASIPVTVTNTPTALLSVSPSTLTFTENTTGEVIITNSLASPVAALAIAASIPGSSAITEATNNCGPSLSIGASCQITFTSPSVEGPTAVTIGGTNTTIEPVNITVSATPNAAISINPSTLAFNAGEVRSITVTNTQGSPATAQNITASVPAGSSITVNNNCPASLPTDTTCTIEFTSLVSTQETAITISGTNTNTEQANLTVAPSCIPITSQTVPSVSITTTGPVINPGNTIDANLTNFATMSGSFGPSIVSIRINGLSYPNAAICGVSMLTNLAQGDHSLETYKNNALRSIRLFTPTAVQTTYSFPCDDFDAIRIVSSQINGLPYNASVFYFCAGQ